MICPFSSTTIVDKFMSIEAMMYGLTMSLKNEIVQIAPRGRVNTVAPGWVRTPMAESALQNPQIVYQALATYVSHSLSLAIVGSPCSFRTPLKKVATPEDIASQIVVLSSSTVSGHVTGQVIMVEGGMEGRLLNHPEDISA